MSNSRRMMFALEELVFLLQLLGIEHLPGLGDDPLGFLNDEQQALVLDVATRTLYARQLVNWQTPGGYQVDAAISSLLCMFAQPRKTCYINSEGSGTGQTSVLAFDQHTATEFSQVSPGLYRFTPVGDASQAQALIAQTLSFLDTTGTGRPGIIAQAYLAQARQCAPHDPHAASTILARALTPETAAGLAHALASPQSIQNLHLYDHQTDLGISLALVQSAQGIYLLRQQNLSEYRVIPADAAKAWAIVLDFLSPALRLLPGSDGE